MMILDKHLWRATLTGLLMAWLALVMLDVFFAFIEEVKKTDDQYSNVQAFIYLIFTLPGRFYNYFPPAILIGTLLGLGNLSENSEFIAMRAAGISIRQIIFSIVKLGLVLVILVFFLGEVVVPRADLQARNFKAHLKNNNITLVGGAGLWVKEKHKIIHIGQLITKDKLADISIYTFKDDFSGLVSLKTVSSAKFEEDKWILSQINTSIFHEEFIKKQFQDSVIEKDFMDANILDIGTAKPEQLSITELDTIIEHQKNNQLKASKYQLIYWKRYSIPISALVMLVIAMPFLFGSSRGGGTGQRVFIGIVVGIVFSLVNSALNDLGSVYGFTPMISAFLPSLIFLIGGLFFLSRIR